mmetsp:Transcript_119481/g.273773  ORF Transcript_119481/g.273773 Transcript_119481/m.273773 type:complete len:894 (+) Transcript_119481:133-2814(+)
MAAPASEVDSGGVQPPSLGSLAEPAPGRCSRNGSQRPAASRASDRPGDAGDVASNTPPQASRANTVDELVEDPVKSEGANIFVAVRSRALQAHERAVGGRDIVRCLDKRVVVLVDPATTAADDYLRLNKTREKRYAFDVVFDQNDGQETVYNQSSKFLLDGTLNGYNSTVFSYGATGAGKTYTMLGNYHQPGLMMMTMQDLFLKVDKERDNKVFEVKCSFLEVYNEMIRDLLNPSSEAGDHLDLREDPVKGMCVAGISEVGGLSTAEEIMNLLLEGNRHRTTEPTAANVVSSRSHAVLQVIVEQKDKTAGASAAIHVGKLAMIDLAGSERASQTNNRGLRMIEGANINRSLLALGNCITALSEKGAKGAFVPYRDSKLTRLLKDSLGGNCRTVMIAAISPCHLNFDDTHNTLKYANRAKNIKTAATKNIVNVNYHISKYTQIIHELRNEVTDLKTRLVSTTCARCTSLPPVPTMDDETRQAVEGMQLEIATAFESLRAAKKSLALAEHQRRQRSPGRKSPKIDQAAQEDKENLPATTDEGICVALGLDATSGSPEDQAYEELTANVATLTENVEKLEAEITTRVEAEDMRGFLRTLFQTKRMELDTEELDAKRKADLTALKQKDAEVERLRAQLAVRDRMLMEHRELLTDVQLASLPKHTAYISSPLGRTPSEPPPRSMRPKTILADGSGLPPIGPPRIPVAGLRQEETPSPVRLPSIQPRGRISSRERAQDRERGKTRSPSRGSLRSAASDRDTVRQVVRGDRYDRNSRLRGREDVSARARGPNRRVSYLPTTRQPGTSAPPPVREVSRRRHPSGPRGIRSVGPGENADPRLRRPGPKPASGKPAWYPRTVDPADAAAAADGPEQSRPVPVVRPAKKDVLRRLNVAMAPPDN